MSTKLSRPSRFPLRAMRVVVPVAAAVGLASCSAIDEELPLEGPILAVLISVDQMRGDFMNSSEDGRPYYGTVFSEGLARLREEGYQFANAAHGHAVTHTAPGHAVLATGVHPYRSGIVANSWQERDADDPSGWRSMYAVEDETSPLVGLTPPGFASGSEMDPTDGRSPRNLQVEGLADWTIAHDRGARAIAVSAKDRAAITLAGRAGEAYWLAAETGRFVTSTYYSDTLPTWVEAFNSEVMPGLSADTAWESMATPEMAQLARPDEAEYEADGVHSTFPHILSLEADSSAAARGEWLFRTTPKADEAVLEFAYRAITELELGQRGSVDYLAVSLSATDYIGHRYGPFSQEQLSNLIHLDRALGRFFAYLDESVGAGKWVMALSSDHGVATMPEASIEWGTTPGRRLSAEDEIRAMQELWQRAEAEAGNPEEVPATMVRLLNESGRFAKAYTHAEILREPQPDSFAAFLRNSLHPDRSASSLGVRGIEVVVRPGDLVYWGLQGTTHGTPHRYDRWVPLVFHGAGVEPGIDHDGVQTVDAAPTLATLAGIPTPDDLDGIALFGRR